MKNPVLAFLSFRRMVAPIVLQGLFWPAAIACVCYSVWLIRQGYPIGWVPLIVGTLFVRVVFEGLIVFFRILSTLSAIQAGLEMDRVPGTE